MRQNIRKAIQLPALSAMPFFFRINSSYSNLPPQVLFYADKREQACVLFALQLRLFRAVPFTTLLLFTKAPIIQPIHQPLFALRRERCREKRTIKGVRIPLQHTRQHAHIPNTRSSVQPLGHQQTPPISRNQANGALSPPIRKRQ